MDMIIDNACQIVKQKHHLTKAETHVMSLLTQGYKPKEIANLRSRSIETVRTQIKALKYKLVVYRTAHIPDLVHSHMQQAA